MKIKSKTYDEFVEKFKPKKTTDDCYTPPKVYDAIADWVSNEYGIDKALFVRPFYPGGDYQKFDYNGGVVVDNPPFSIFSETISFYIDNNIKFFLFAPTLTMFSGQAEKYTILPVGVHIIYENGANVNTSFVTNLEPSDVRVRTVPTLYNAVNEANNKNLKEIRKQVPKYVYPPYITTAAKLYPLSRAGIEIIIPKNESISIERLDSQKGTGKKIFGKGLLLSERCVKMLEAAEREKAEREKAERKKAEREKVERWQLSEREWQIIKKISGEPD